MRKKKIILKNSYKSDKILNKFFNKNLDFQSIRNDFFKKTFFSYPDINEKNKIISLLKEVTSVNYNNIIFFAFYS